MATFLDAQINVNFAYLIKNVTKQSIFATIRCIFASPYFSCPY